MTLIILGSVFVAILTTSFFLYISFILEKLCIIVKPRTLTVPFLLTSFMAVFVRGQYCSSKFITSAEAFGGACLVRSENLSFHSSLLISQTSSAVHGGGGGSGVPFNA